MNPDSDGTHFDVVIVGGGPAGYAAALYGASAGLSMAMIERSKVGGTCLHVGCIPAKELLETAAVYRHVSHAGDFGINAGTPTVDWPVTLNRKQSIISGLHKGLEGMLKGRNVTVFNGTGRVDADNSISITSGAETARITGDSVVLAAGSVPRTIPGFDIDGSLVVTSDELLSISQLPSSAAVIGGGAIGSEFASMMSDLGTKVTIVEAMDKILPGLDADVAKVVNRSFKKRGIDIRTGARVAGHTPFAGGTNVHIEGGDDLAVELVVMAIGRRPFSDLLGLDDTAIAVDPRGFIEVDEACRTSVPGIYAVGDVVDTPQLAHIGFAEGMMVIRDILGEDPVPIDYDKVPWAIYCHPEVAFAGHSEESAVAAGFEIVSSSHRHMANGRAMIIGETEGMVKVIAEKLPDGTGGTVLGVHMVGPWVTEQLGQGYLAVNWEATVSEVAAFIQPHPTMSELFGESMLSLTGRSLH